MRPGLSISLWAQYVLDNFATVSETVEVLAREPFALVSSYVPNMPDKFATLHLSLSDPTGNNAIFEYIGGRPVIRHNPSYRVMTNSPVFEQQLVLNACWSEIGGTTMLPGTNRAADQRDRVYFFEPVLSPNVFWVDSRDVDFSPDAPVRRLKLTGGRIYSGNAAADFEVSEPFVFEGI